MLFVGLGNPGEQYHNNRHNIGFMVVDALAQTHKFSVPKTKFKGIVQEGTFQGKKVYLFKPLTYMNLSGTAVSELANFYKIPLHEIVVIHDDLDLDPGKIRMKQGGGHGGHNGLKSLDAHLGNDYWRLRIGIGHPGVRDFVSPYVLSNFSKADYMWLKPLIEAIVDEFGLLVEGNFSKFMSLVPQRLK